MRSVWIQSIGLIFAASLCFVLGGCGKDTTPEGPEMGSIERYLEEHPEAREDAEVASEDEEFGAAGSE